MPDTHSPAALMFAELGFPVGLCCRPTATGCSYPKHTKDAPCKFPGKAPDTLSRRQGVYHRPRKNSAVFCLVSDRQLWRGDGPGQRTLRH
jgi:hypothetical protein